MPIGAVIGGAVIGAGGQIIAGSQAAKAQKKAAETAADTSLQVAQLNTDLYRDIYEQNSAMLQPWQDRGALASYALTDLLLGTNMFETAMAGGTPGGAGAPSAPTVPTAPGGTSSPPIVAPPGAAPSNGALAPYTAPPSANPVVGNSGTIAINPNATSIYQPGALQAVAPPPGGGGNMIAMINAGEGPLSAAVGASEPGAVEASMVNQTISPAARAYLMGGEPMGGVSTPTYGPGSWQASSAPGQVAGAGAGTIGGGSPAPAPTPTTGPAPAPTPTPGAGSGGSALSAWDQFREGTNYQWRFNQGMEALNSSYAAGGMFESGAADKARIEYGQNFASNELANYMNLLAGQQAMGLSAAGAVAGVSTTYAGNVAAQNTNAANAAANAALMQGQAAANQWGSVGTAAGQIGGALYQYGMGQTLPQASYAPAGSGPIVVTSSGAPSNWGAF